MFHFFKLLILVNFTTRLIASETQTACITKMINLPVELRFFNHDNRDFAYDEIMFSYTISKKLSVLFDAEEC